MNKIKSTLTLLASLLALSAVADSKPVDESSFKFGIQGGLNISNAELQSNLGSNSITGFTAGVLAEASLIPGLIYLQPELNLIQKGANNSDFGTLGTTHLTYGEVSLLAKAKLTINLFKPFILAGPTAAVLVGSSGPGADTHNLSTVDLGFDLGAGFAIATGETSELMFTFRKKFGLININSNNNSSWTNDGVSFTVGYLF